MNVFLYRLLNFICEHAIEMLLIIAAVLTLVVASPAEPAVGQPLEKIMRYTRSDGVKRTVWVTHGAVEVREGDRVVFSDTFTDANIDGDKAFSFYRAVD